MMEQMIYRLVAEEVPVLLLRKGHGSWKCCWSAWRAAKPKCLTGGTFGELTDHKEREQIREMISGNWD